MNTNKKIGNKLRVLREVHNYTQEYVANILDVAPNTYSLMEKGQAQFTIERMEKLASLYKMDLSDLLNLNNQIIIHSIHNSNGICSENFSINNTIHEDERKMYKEVIQQLREQNNKLEEQNERLLHLLEKLSETK